MSKTQSSGGSMIDINSDWIDQLISTEEAKPEDPNAKIPVRSVRNVSDTIKENLKDFSGLLDSLSSTTDKKKALWKQIYENAVTDRMNAYLIFTDLYIKVFGEAEKHALHGLTLTKYLERMSRANDQLIKLAELVASVKNKESEAEELSEDDLYEKIGKH